MARTTPVLALLLAAACGSPADRPTCRGDADCGPGFRCLQTTEGGVCWPGSGLSLDAPAANALVGSAGVPVAATLILKAGATAPASVELLANGAAVGSLAKGAAAGSAVPYAGRYGPPGTLNGAVALKVRANVDREQLESAPVTVTVDTQAPQLGTVAATCAGGCKRDGLLAVTAAASDAHLESVKVALDLDPARPVAMTAGGGGYQAQVALEGLPFPHFARTVVATVTAKDGAGNEVSRTVDVPVTRLRWATAADSSNPPQLTGAAIDQGGNIIVAGNNSRLYFYSSSGAAPTSATVGSIGITAALSIGPTAIWVASEDGRIYPVDRAGAILNGTGCSTGGSVKGTPALSGNPETAFAGSSAGRIFAVDAGTTCVASPRTDGFSAAPVISRAGDVLAATATATATATLRQYLFDGAAFTPGWTAQVGVAVSAPVALDGLGNAWTGSQDGKLNKTTSSGTTATVKTLAGSIVDSPVILANGDVVVGDQTSVIHRFAPDGTQIWGSEPTLDGPALAPLVLKGGDAALLVPTMAGSVHALRGDGTVSWSGKLSGQSLREGNIHTPPGSAIGTAYFGCADGKLYAVAVDGALDTSAPWPKSHHDVRNTGNAASPLP